MKVNDLPPPKDIPALPFINMSRWDDEPVPEQEWTVHNRIPARQCVLFTGEGAAGKSTIDLHLSAAHALGRDWLGSLPEPGPAIYIDAEDEENVQHYRLAAVIKHYGVRFDDLIKGGLHLISLAGQDAVLATVIHNGKVEPTPLYHALLQAAGDIKPKSIGIGSCANVFTGDENNRSQVQQFISLLTRVARLANGSVVLISHPSLTGINSDSGLSGTTQWHNAVRARFYLKSIKPDDDEQPDNDLREIVFKKNQYGPQGDSVVVRYQNGMYLPVPGATSFDRVAHDAKADELFVRLLNKLDRRGENVSPKRTANMYGPTVFAKEPEAKTASVKKADFEQALARLLNADKVHVADYGPPSRSANKLLPGPAPAGQPPE